MAGESWTVAGIVRNRASYGRGSRVILVGLRCGEFCLMLLYADVRKRCVERYVNTAMRVLRIGKRYFAGVRGVGVDETILEDYLENCHYDISMGEITGSSWGFYLGIMLVVEANRYDGEIRVYLHGCSK